MEEIMEGHSFTSFDYNNVSSTTIGNSGTPYDSYNFQHLDRYVEKIRSLFVPSLEPRIHSCLETLVYRKESGSENPCLKKCLEVADSWQEPIDNFFTKLSNEGLLEYIIGHAVKYLINGGLIDCFLNSIILNNRLNKVCQNLDELGIKRDLFRYLNVWNYMHERDYWIEGDQKISMSMSHESWDSMNCESDLDVEVGSKLYNHRRHRISKSSLNRRATDDSSLESQKDKNSSENFDTNDQLLLRHQSCLSIESSAPEKCKSRDGRRRPISQILPCRSSNCPTYRLKSSRRIDWGGKFLKLHVADACAMNSKCDTPKCVKLSKLRLPCEFDDFISKFVRADSTFSELFSITRRKKFEASVITVCRRINEILEKLDKSEVKKCRLHCEIFPAHFSFRMIKRETDGRKICLLNELIAINKSEYKSRCNSQGSSSTQFPHITENGNSRESGLTIYASARFDLGDEISQRIERSRKKSEVTLDSKETALKNESQSFWNEKGAEDLTCHCEAVDPLFNHLDLNTQKNSYPDNPKDFQIEASVNDLRDSIREKSLINYNDDMNNIDEMCMCSGHFDGVTHYSGNEPKNSQICMSSGLFDGVTHHRGNEPKNSQGRCHILEHEAEPNDHSAAVGPENPFCLCNDSFHDKLDLSDDQMEKNCAELVPKKSLFCLLDDKMIDRAILDSNSVEIQSKSGNDVEKSLSTSYLGECFDKKIGDIPEFSRQASNKSFTMNVEKVEDTKGTLSHSVVERSSVINLDVIPTQSNLTYMKCVPSAPDGNKLEGAHIKIACECPSDCTCANKGTLNDENADSLSQCSCDVSHYDDRIKTLSPIEDPPVKHVSSEESKVKSSCIDTQTDSREFKKFVLKPLSSRSSEQKGTRTADSYYSERISERYLKNGETSRSFCHKNSPIISTRLPSSKGQMINISIELCPESASSIEKIRNNHEKNILSLRNDRRRENKFDYIQTRFLPVVRRSRCHRIDRGHSSIQINHFSEKNINYEYLDGSNRVHSPPRPLESRDYVPPLEWHAASVRNSNVYGNPIKSDLRSNKKFSVRSTSEGQKSLKEYKAKEFCASFDDNQRYKENNQRKMSLNRDKQSSKLPPSSKRFPSSFINGHLCQAFSADSVDRMRHLIKKKLRRILLERDKSTNTPKTILTNERYHVSVPNGKIERFPFSRNGCRTIWESRSASDSTRSSRSISLANHTGIRDREKICHLLYSSTKKSKNSSQNFDGISQNSDYSTCDMKSIDLPNDLKDDRRKLDSIENSSRLAGGSDLVPQKTKPDPGEYFFSHKERLQPSKKKSECSCDPEHKKHYGTSFNCKVHEMFQNESRLLKNDNFNYGISSRNYREKVISGSRKLDPPRNATSEHIYLYEFAQYESSNDVPPQSRWNRVNADGSKRIYSPGICNEQMDVKKLWIKKRVRGKNVQNLRSRHMTFCPNNNNDSSRSIHDIEVSLSNVNTINSRQKGFNYLDYDLRSKLLQYVNLCKNIKYSLLRRLRPNDIYEVTRSSISCRDQYKIGDI